MIAMAYKALPADQQARLDPMIVGFNPVDMYAADHIRRVLLTFPGVFSGIGEFSIHKEFVSSKIAGGVANLNNRALDRILDFAGEVGLVVILHNDIDMPFPKPDQDPYILKQMKDLIARHPKTKIIWAHAGVGRVVRPVKDQTRIFDRALANPSWRTCTSTSRGTRRPSTSPRRRKGCSGRRTSSTSTRTASCSVRTWSPPRASTRRWRCTTRTPRCGSC